MKIHIQCIFAHRSVCFCYACHLPSHHIKEAAFGAAPLCGFLYGGWGGGKHSKNIQTYEQICIEYVFSCIYRQLGPGPAAREARAHIRAIFASDY